MNDIFSKRSRGFLGFFFLLFIQFTFSQTVKTIDENGLDSLVKNRSGKVLVLNVWATWCEPCREEFPDLIKLSNELKDMNVEFIAISVDYPDEIESKINPFLDTMNVPFQVFVSDFPSQDSFINKFDKNWSGAVPATFIYDKKGKHQSFLLGKQSYHQFKKAIEDVLRKP